MSGATSSLAELRNVINKRIDDLVCEVRRIADNSDRHNSTLQRHSEAFNRLTRDKTTHSMAIDKICEVLGLDLDDALDEASPNNIDDLRQLFVTANDKVERAENSIRSMHNLLLQLQQRVRAIRFKVGPEVTVPIEAGAAKAPNSTEAPEQVAFESIAAADMHWREQVRRMRADYDAQMQALRAELEAERDISAGHMRRVNELENMIEEKNAK